MKTNLIDSHFHINRLTNYKEKIFRALENGVCAGLVAGVWNEDTLDIIQSYFDKDKIIFHRRPTFSLNDLQLNKFSCFLAHGLHPAFIHINWLLEDGLLNEGKMGKDIELFKKILDENQEHIWAIGETGFDLSRDIIQHPSSVRQTKEQILKLQTIAFDVCVEQAIAYDLPLIVHTRNAWKFTLSKLKEARKKGLKNIMIHCYSGSAEELKELEKLKIYCSFGGVTTWKKASKVKGAFVSCKENLRLLETDSPDLSPEFLDGTRLSENEPSTLNFIAKVCASYLNCSMETLVQQININFVNFLANRIES